MSTTPPPRPERRPFYPRGKVYARTWQITMDEAVEAARTAGFHVTPRSGPNRVYVQRNWSTAAWITPTHGGVVIKPAWTTGQMYAVAGVLVVLVLGFCAC
ncbi:hypothetical protein [Micromonospora aurantiaca (nom. illeg.)]|uniref:hypothetical protein n=2 Tax=Micromonospora aurantiaca (nom. illeg.) TaxID=47850 RepID=UPI0011A18F9D